MIIESIIIGFSMIVSSFIFGIILPFGFSIANKELIEIFAEKEESK